MKQFIIGGVRFLLEIFIPAIALVMSDAVTTGAVLVGANVVVTTERERGLGTGLDVTEG
jgi:hypothetical protein